MYITLSSVKRSLGFKGLEVNDLIIAFPLIILFLVLFCFTNYKLFAVFILIISIFLLIPVKVSQKNRMYKVLLLISKYLISIKEFTYFKLRGLKDEDTRRKRKETGFKNKK